MIDFYLAAKTGIEPVTNRLTADYSTSELHGQFLLAGNGIRTHDERVEVSNVTATLCLQDGVPDRIRTCGLSLRKRLLYPSELREHFNWLEGFVLFVPRFNGEPGLFRLRPYGRFSSGGPPGT
jgi:hypothetical protein